MTVITTIREKWYRIIYRYVWRWRVIYPDGEVSRRMIYPTARGYADIFGGVVMLED